MQLVNTPCKPPNNCMQVNMSLRQQARAGMVYAPGLTYVPDLNSSGGPMSDSLGNGNGSFSNGNGNAAATAAPAAPAVATATIVAPPKPASLADAAAPEAPATDKTLMSMDDDEMSPDQIACRWAGGRARRAVCGNMKHHHHHHQQQASPPLSQPPVISHRPLNTTHPPPQPAAPQGLPPRRQAPVEGEERRRRDGAVREGADAVDGAEGPRAGAARNARAGGVGAAAGGGAVVGARFGGGSHCLIHSSHALLEGRTVFIPHQTPTESLNRTPSTEPAPDPQGQYKAAIKHLERVLEISKEMREFTGDADAVSSSRRLAQFSYL